MKRLGFTSLAAAIVIAAFAAGHDSPVQAGNWGFSFGLSSPGGHFGYAQYAPPPIYAPPVVVYPAPPPCYGPWGCGPHVHYAAPPIAPWHHHHHHHHHGW